MGWDNFGVKAIFGENRELLNLHKAFLQVLQNNGSYTCAYFELHFENTIKMKFGQILVRCMTHISNMFQA